MSWRVQRRQGRSSGGKLFTVGETPPPHGVLLVLARPRQLREGRRRVSMRQHWRSSGMIAVTVRHQYQIEARPVAGQRRIEIPKMIRLADAGVDQGSART